MSSPSSLVGRRVRQLFHVTSSNKKKKNGKDAAAAPQWFRGTVVERWKPPPSTDGGDDAEKDVEVDSDDEDYYYYRVRYEDGDEEDLTRDQVRALLVEDDDDDDDEDQAVGSSPSRTTCCGERCQQQRQATGTISQWVRWKPCGCTRLCQECAMQLLMDHSLAAAAASASSSDPPPPLRCPTCGQTIRGHEFVNNSGASAGAGAKDGGGGGEPSPPPPAAAAVSSARTKKKANQHRTTAAAASPPSQRKRKKLPLTSATATATPTSTSETPPNKRGPHTPFAERLRQLQEYKSVHGHLRVPSTFPSLGPWLAGMRRGKLKCPPEQRQQLDALGLAEDVWAERPRGRIPQPKPPKVYQRGPYTRVPFDARFEQLREFRAAHGHVRVPVRCTEIPALGEWVKDVRTGRRKVSPEQRKRLNQLGFVWETGPNRKNREWDAQFDKLREYQQTHGDCNIPWRWSENIKLAEWVHTQRKDYRSQSLRQDRRERLEALGFAWWMGKGALPAQPTEPKKKRKRKQLLQQQHPPESSAAAAAPPAVPQQPAAHDAEAESAAAAAVGQHAVPQPAMHDAEAESAAADAPFAAPALWQL